MRSSSTLCLAVWLAAAPLLAAQAPEAGAPTPPPTFPLGLDQAVQFALQNSPDILVERFGPDSGREEVRSAQGAYDPFLDGNLLRTYREFQGTNRLAGGQTLESTRFEY